MSPINIQVDSDAPKWAQTFMTSVKSGFESLSAEVKNMNSGMTGLTNKLSDLEASLMNSVRVATERADEALSTALKCNQVLVDVQSELKTVKYMCEDLKTENTKLRQQTSNLENYSRRNNLIIRNIDETNDNMACDVLVKQFFRRHLISEDSGDDQDVINRMRFIRCHRLGVNDPNNKRARPIIVRFSDFSDRQWVWVKRSALKNTKFSLQENFAAAVEYNRRKLYPIFNAARKMEAYGNKVSLNGDTLIIDSKRYHVGMMDTLPGNLHPKNFTHRSNDSTYVFGGLLSEYSSLSNYGRAEFKFGDTEFSNAEQAIQYCKAVKFKDAESAEQILRTDDPGKAKSLGQTVSGFNKHSWNIVKGDIVHKIVKAKFEQNADCQTDLLNTGNKKLGESGMDSYFAVGLPLTHNKILDSSAWVSKNKLGSILMLIRSELQQQ